MPKLTTVSARNVTADFTRPWNTKIHLVAADDVHAIGLRLSPGQHGDGPEGRELIGNLGCPADGCALVMDRAYEGDETRGLASLLGSKPVVPPNPQRLKPWKLDKAAYRQRNHVERLIRRLKGFRRVFTRYDKLDVLSAPSSPSLSSGSRWHSVNMP